MSCSQCDHFRGIGGGSAGVLSQCKLGEQLWQIDCLHDTSIDDRDRSKYENQTLGASSYRWGND